MTIDKIDWEVVLTSMILFFAGYMWRYIQVEFGLIPWKIVLISHSIHLTQHVHTVMRWWWVWLAMRSSQINYRWYTMIKHKDIQDDIIAAIKELHLENDQLRNQLDNVITTLRELQNEHIKLKGLVELLVRKINWRIHHVESINHQGYLLPIIRTTSQCDSLWTIVW